MSSSAATRAISLSAAGVLALSLMLTPQVLGPQVASGAAHVGLCLALFGMAGGFVHGFDFHPDHLALRILFSPWMSWALMVGGLWLAIDPIQ